MMGADPAPAHALMPTPDIPDFLRVVEIKPGYALGEVDQVLVMVWREQPTDAAFELRRRELVELVRRHPGHCAYLEVIESGSKPPNDELRKKAVEVFRGAGKDLCCVGFTMDGPELRTALVRAILTGMTFLVSQMQPSRVFKSVIEMARWTQTRMGVAEPAFPGRIQASFDYLRRSST
jgi:hypothetical protein